MVRFAEFAARPYARETLDLLTDEEEAVLMMRRRGKSVVEISVAMGLSPETVHRRQRSAMKKIG